MTNEKKAEKILEKLSIKRFLNGKNVSFIGNSLHEKNSCWTIEIRIEPELMLYSSITS